MGLFFKKTAPPDDLLTRGIRGKGTVEHVAQSMMSTEVGLSGRRGQRVMSGEETPIRRKVTLRIELPGRPPYSVTTKLPVPLMQSSWVVAGTTFEVLVDPDKPDRVAIDWNAPRQRGTLQDMMADNPIAAAAMRGAGIDPAALQAQMEATQRAVAAWQAANPQWAQMMPGGVPTPGGVPAPGSQWPPATPAPQPGAQWPGTPGTPAIQAPQWLPGTPGTPGATDASQWPGSTPWPAEKPEDEEPPKPPQP